MYHYTVRRELIASMNSPIKEHDTMNYMPHTACRYRAETQKLWKEKTSNVKQDELESHRHRAESKASYRVNVSQR